MAKRFKLKLNLSRVLPSLQLCRSKHPSTFPETPRPGIYRLSPVNPKALDIGYPQLPAPPPSTPVEVASVRCGCRGSSPEYYTSKSRDPELKQTKGKLEETQTLISPSGSVSDDSSLEFSSLESRSKRIKKMRKMRRCGWKERVPAVAGGKVRGSVAVMKTSEDPYEDFRRSMLEMILEKEIFEAEELEQLLQCFLSLNSRDYHGVIVEAFTKIWEDLFCASPRNSHCSHTKI